MAAPSVSNRSFDRPISYFFLLEDCEKTSLDELYQGKVIHPDRILHLDCGSQRGAYDLKEIFSQLPKLRSIHFDILPGPVQPLIEMLVKNDEYRDKLHWMSHTLYCPVDDKWLNQCFSCSLRHVGFHTLDLRDGGLITDKGLSFLPKCPNLQGLNIGSCNQLTDASFQSILDNCPHLRTFGISDRQLNSHFHCEKILENRDIVDLTLYNDGEYYDLTARAVNHCPNLRHLRLVGPVFWTDRQVAKIRSHCPSSLKIEVLNV